MCSQCTFFVVLSFHSLLSIQTCPKYLSYSINCSSGMWNSDCECLLIKHLTMAWTYNGVETNYDSECEQYVRVRVRWVGEKNLKKRTDWVYTLYTVINT